MIIRNLDINHDWMFGKGLSSYLLNEMALELNIATRILSWRSDCFFALNEGIDYKNLLDKGQVQNLTLATKSIILSSEGVLKVNTISFNLDDNRRLNIVYSIDTIYGQDFQNTISRELI